MNSRAHIRGKSTSRIRHGIGGHCISESLCRSRTGTFQAFARQRGLQSGFNAGSCILCISGEIIAAHAFAYTRRDVLAGGLDTFGGRFNLQRRVQRGFEVGRDRFRVAVKARLRHALRDALADVRAGAGRVQSVQKIKNALQIVQILFRHLHALMDGTDHLSNVS